jgi:tRNA(adenine34) deaminase
MPMTADARDLQILARCIELSRYATTQGENPFACIICEDSETVAETTTRAARDGDVTRHAELLAISEAQSKLKTKNLSNCTLYSNVEPCAMCAYCIRETKIRRVVYSIPSPVMGGLSKWNILKDAGICDALPELFERPPEVVGRVMEAEAERVWREWHPLDWAFLRYRHAIGSDAPIRPRWSWRRLFSWSG